MATLTVQDARPPTSFDLLVPWPRDKAVFPLVAGSLLLYPCWIQFDLVLSADAGTSGEAHAFLELSASVSLEDLEGAKADDDWLRTPIRHDEDAMPRP
jgi:hypothetical protein